MHTQYSACHIHSTHLCHLLPCQAHLESVCLLFHQNQYFDLDWIASVQPRQSHAGQPSKFHPLSWFRLRCKHFQYHNQKRLYQQNLHNLTSMVYRSHFHQRLLRQRLGQVRHCLACNSQHLLHRYQTIQ